MIDVRTARSSAVARESTAREMQVAGTRKVDLDGAVAVDVDIAGASH